MIVSKKEAGILTYTKVEKSVSEESLDALEENPGYRCLDCFDVFTHKEMNGNTNKCPNCGEENIQ